MDGMNVILLAAWCVAMEHDGRMCQGISCDGKVYASAGTL
jgi:hypothetical protein